ncbi:MAG TPA: hydantoinase/oxoprolinase family protein [Burkholderiaceae bacterium]|nr:hydantoinase/oxoprolinase family protein [Burkholderiaceae bacterium]
MISDKQPRIVIGWDLGGANVKATRLCDGEVIDIAQWPCPLWQGLNFLQDVLARARVRWPDCATAEHAVTMTGEMADLFPHRQAGVVALAAAMIEAFGPRVCFYAGAAGWLAQAAVEAGWLQVASANWSATAQLVASRVPDAVLVDIGTTTTDIIPICAGAVVAQGQDDAGRLASGELVYSGVARTPLCALTRRIAFNGVAYNVMNELFATTADVYRLTGELPAEHDPHPPADGGAKTLAATRQRLARMIGMDAREAGNTAWRAFADAWREAQLAELEDNLRRVLEVHAARGGVASAPLVAAGCGHFLARELAQRVGVPCLTFEKVLRLHSAHALWARVCAPSAAVALLYDAQRAVRDSDKPASQPVAAGTMEGTGEEAVCGS